MTLQEESKGGAILDITNKKHIFDYDVNNFNFSELFVKHLSSFNIDNLQNLHSHLPKTLLPKEIVNVENDQSMPIYEILYKIDKGYDLNNSNQSGIFLNTYKDFVHHLSSTIFKEKLIYQRKPTLRIHLPENKSVGGFHRDRDYNHPIEEINIWVPITTANDTNTIWIESSFDKNDYSPMNLNYGEFLIFDSGLKHGNKINLENKTRISFDFRIIPETIWQNKKIKKNKFSADSKMEFDIGGYYKLMKI